MRHNSIRVFIDWSFIILNVTSSLSIIGAILFDRIPLPGYISLFIFNIITYFIRWKTSFYFLLLVKDHFLLLVFYLIYLVDIFQNLFIAPAWAIARIVTFFNVFFFLEYIYNLYRSSIKTEGVFSIIKPYFAFSYYNVIVVCLAGLLIFFHVINPQSNMLTGNSLIANNIGAGQIVYWPSYLSIAIDNGRLLGEWGIPITLTGLSHEPHVLNFLIMPSLFFIRAYNKSNKWYWAIVVTYAISLFFSFSTTAFISLMFVLFVEILWRFFRRGQFIFIFVIIVAAVGLIWVDNQIHLFSLIQDELFRKTVDQTGSLDYSGAMLNYITSPNSAFGSGNLPQSNMALSSQDVGFITFLLDIVFYMLLIVSAVKIVLSKDEKKHFIGLGCLYMLIHMLKVNLLAFNYMYLALIVFILVVCTSRKTPVNYDVR